MRKNTRLSFLSKTFFLLLLPCAFCHANHIPSYESSSPYDELEELLPAFRYGWYWEGNARALHHLIEQFSVHSIIEVGSFLGESTIDLASHLPEGGMLYAIDHWLGSSEHQPDSSAPSPIPLDRLYDQFLSNVIHAGLAHRIVPIRMDSLAAAKNNTLTADLIYIDAAHDTESVYRDLVAWWPHLNENGILSGDDWWSEDVKRAVVQFAQEHPGLRLYAVENFYFFLKIS